MFYAVYCGVPLLLLILFGLLRPKLAPLVLLLCPLIDFLVYHQEFFHYEGRAFFLLFTAVQFLILTGPACILSAIGAAKEKNHDN